MSDGQAREHRSTASGQPPEPGPDDLEVLLFGGDGPELSPAQAERNTELLTALTTAARDCGVVPIFLQLPAAPTGATAPATAPDPEAAPGAVTGGDAPPFEEAYCLRMGVRTAGVSRWARSTS